MKKNPEEKFLHRFKERYSNLLFKFRSLSFVKHILVFYLFITLIGSLLLYLPISRNEDIGYVDALFTSASAFSDTGLATLVTAKTWTLFGQAIIAILILIGGIGWFALKIYLINILFGKTLSFRARETLAAERGSSIVGNTRRIVKISVTILFVLIILATFVLSIYFYFVEPDQNPFNDPNVSKDMVIVSPHHDVLTSFRFGLFHSISGLNNAGFDVIGDSSLQPYYHKYGVQIIFIILFVIGGIGYPVLYDIFLWFRSKIFKEEVHKWSLFTKISMTTYLVIVVIGISFAFLSETTNKNVDSLWNSDYYGSRGDKTMAIIFNTLSTRNAGFGSINMAHLAPGTKILYSIMMFIGSAPSSTAGGIRTTTIALVVMSLWSRIRGNKSVRVFKRKINGDTVARAHVVTSAALIIVIVGTMVLMTSWDSYGGEVPHSTRSFTDLLFETSSAFGTTGLSTGITGQLSMASKLILILIMFVGQLGVSSTLLVWDKKNNKSRKYKLVEEDVTIG